MPERDPLDPLVALRAMGEVQRAGLEAAATVVERILEVGRHGTRRPNSFHLPAQPVNGADSNGSDPRSGEGAHDGVDAEAGGDSAAGREREVRRLRADGERLLELWGEWMRVLLDAAVDGAEAGVAQRDGGAHSTGQMLRLGPVKPGQAASASAWMHLFDGPPGAPASLSATAFTAHDGDTIKARAASFEPPMLESFDVRSSHELVVTVAVPRGTRPGAYYGHILARGLPEVSLPVQLEVEE